VSERFFCSDASVERGEPLHGTASTVQRWLLVEQSGAWGAQALRDNALGREVGARLQRLGRTLGARVLLIRRHGRYEQRGHRVFAAFTGRGSRWLERLDFADAEAILAHDFGPLRQGSSVGGVVERELHAFVCTHGKHDPCCAKKGRLIAHALADSHPETVWETSHIGGDRFAGNVLFLPLGIYYGRVEAPQATRLMNRLAAGKLDLPHYRGRTSYPFAAQAAEWLVRERLTLVGLDELRLEAHEATDLGVRTTFRRPDGKLVTIEVEETAAAPARLTCRANDEHRAPGWRLHSLREH